MKIEIINNLNGKKVIAVGFMSPTGFNERIDIKTGQYSNTLNSAEYGRRGVITNKAVKYSDGTSEEAVWNATRENEITVE